MNQHCARCLAPSVYEILMRAGIGHWRPRSEHARMRPCPGGRPRRTWKVPLVGGLHHAQIDFARRSGACASRCHRRCTDVHRWRIQPGRRQCGTGSARRNRRTCVRPRRCSRRSGARSDGHARLNTHIATGFRSGQRAPCAHARTRGRRPQHRGTQEIRRHTLAIAAAGRDEVTPPQTDCSRHQDLSKSVQSGCVAAIARNSACSAASSRTCLSNNASARNTCGQW